MESTAALSVVFTAPELGLRNAPPEPRTDQSARKRAASPPIEHPAVEQPAVVVVELPGADGSRVVRALLDGTEHLPTVPTGSYLVLRAGPPGDAMAFVPGYRQPGDPLLADTVEDEESAPATAASAPSRPPRRVETTVPAGLLAQAALVVAPPTGAFGPAYSRIVLDAAERGGAMLLVAAAPMPLGEPELELAVQAIERGVVVFLALSQAMSGAVAVARAEAERHAPVLAELAWFAVDDPSLDGVAALRESVVRWAADERGRRFLVGAGAAAAGRPERTGPIRVSPDAADSGWEELLEREIKWRCHAVWQRVAIELAHIHLRGVHELIFGAGCPGLPYTLDRELHALSIFATRQLDSAVAALVDQLLPQVLAAAPDEHGLRLIGATLRRTLDDEVPAGRARDRVLLVTSTSGLAVVSGTGAEVNLASYRTAPTGPMAAVAAPIGIALTGGCYLFWRDPAHADADKCRYWLQRVVREVESELRRELELRFRELSRGVVALLQDAFEHGIVLI
jgi:hypothetical protein